MILYVSTIISPFTDERKILKICKTYKEAWATISEFYKERKNLCYGFGIEKIFYYGEEDE